jgi:predicted amidohydrolase
LVEKVVVMERKNVVKLALAQYPVSQHAGFDTWKTYVEKWIQDAASTQCDLLVFPEYGSIELTSFAAENVRKDLRKQIQYLSELNAKFVETFQGFARQYGVYIVAPSIPFFVAEKNLTVNRAYIFSKNGQMDFQDKLFMTRFEDEDWGISSSEKVVGEFVQKIFQTEIGNLAISICFDVEFSEPSFSAALAGAEIILAPSCTETIKGCNRVHVGARARALENQFYVAVSQTIGDAPWSIATDFNNGYSALYSTPDLDFTDDGIVAKGVLNKPGWLQTQIPLDKVNEARTKGSVFNYQLRQALPSFGRIPYQIKVLR